MNASSRSEFNETALIKTYVESVHSMTGNGSGGSNHSIGLPSNPLKGISARSSAALSNSMEPSESPKAIYTPVGDTATEVI